MKYCIRNQVIVLDVFAKLVSFYLFVFLLRTLFPFCFISLQLLRSFLHFHLQITHYKIKGVMDEMSFHSQPILPSYSIALEPQVTVLDLFLLSLLWWSIFCSFHVYVIFFLVNSRSNSKDTSGGVKNSGNWGLSNNWMQNLCNFTYWAESWDVPNSSLFWCIWNPRLLIPLAPCFLPFYLPAPFFCLFLPLRTTTAVIIVCLSNWLDLHNFPSLPKHLIPHFSFWTGEQVWLCMYTFCVCVLVCLFVLWYF